MKTIIKWLSDHYRPLVLALYVLMSFFVFFQRTHTLYCHVSILRTTPLGDLPLDLLLFSLLLLGLIFLATLLYGLLLLPNSLITHLSKLV